MNINFHIDRIILDGLVVDSTQARLLQRTVTTQLTKLLTEHGIVSPLAASNNGGHGSSNSFRFGSGANALSLGPQLASAIHASIPQSEICTAVTYGQP